MSKEGIRAIFYEINKGCNEVELEESRMVDNEVKLLKDVVDEVIGVKNIEAKMKMVVEKVKHDESQPLKEVVREAIR